MGNCIQRRKNADAETQTEKYNPSICELQAVNCLEINDISVDYLKLKGYARVDLVYDGDTATFVFWHPSLYKFVRVRIRMAHYDAPEIKGKTDIEKHAAIEAREEFKRLVNFVPGSGRRIKKENRYDSKSDVVWFEVTGMDTRWSRPIMMVWNPSHPERSINSIIHEKYGIDYEGKTKSHVWGEERNINLDYDHVIENID